MTDEHPESPEIEAVRRLLADARHTEPMPHDVAARLDRALADLGRRPTGEPTDEPTHEPTHEQASRVVPLEAGRADRERRRRRAAGLMVAAAVIVVGGVVATQYRPHTGTGSPASGAAGSAAGSESLGSASRAVPRASNGAVVVHTRTLATTALAARSELKVQGRTPHAAPKYDAAQGACVPTPRGGQLLRAVYGGKPAVLVYHRPVGGSQEVDLVVCGASRPIRTVTLPAP
jgi:hypothetical protein